MRLDIADRSDSILFSAMEESQPPSSDDSDAEFDNKDGEDYLANGVEAVIERPGRPSSGEARCLKIITQDQEENWQKKFNMCVVCFYAKFIY